LASSSPFLAARHWTQQSSLRKRTRIGRSKFPLPTARPHWIGPAQSVFEGAEILWVDDRPSNNRNEARMLRSFGALITFAATTEEALRALRASTDQHQPFDLIVSDIGRDLPAPDPTAGLTMLPRLREAGFQQPVIFYVGHVDPGAGAPAGAFGLTNRPDQLLQLTIDALSRVRGRT
jgi:CheY-like chemotaxis protein